MYRVHAQVARLGKAALESKESHPKTITVPITGPLKVCSYDNFLADA
jgi:hypothetical protein